MLRCVLFVTMAAFLVAAAGCSSCRRQPDIAPEAYREVVTAFYTGLAAMQTTQEVLARSKFDRVVALAPGEPAGWANLGLLLLRQQEIEQGTERLTKAASLAPDSAAIQRLLALAEGRRGNLETALGHWRRALEIDPNDLEAAYSQALETERQGGADHDAEAQRLLEQLLKRRDNLAARVEFVRLAAKRGDAAALRAAAGPLSAASTSWSPQAQDQLKAVMATAEANPRGAATRVAFLKNFLLREPIYRVALAEVTTPREEVGQPLMRFLRLKNPDPQPAPADTALKFTVTAARDVPAAASWIGPLALTGEGHEVIATADARGVRIQGMADAIACTSLQSVAADASMGASAVAAADLNYDFRTDLVRTGAGGTCFLQQGAHGRFSDVTTVAKLPSEIQRAPAVAVWPADVDTDGDLDLVLARRDKAPLVLSNNGDGTFAVRDPFATIANARGFAWADLDGEGVPDAAFVDASGTARVLLNQRAGGFESQSLPLAANQVVAIAAAELNGDAILDLLVLGRDGTLTRLSRAAADRTWHAAPIGRVSGLPAVEPGEARLALGDLDNNGATDVIVGAGAQARVLLGAPGGQYVPLEVPLGLDARGVADIDGDGRLEVIGFVGSQPSVAKSAGAKAYHWQVLRTRATTVTGDQRINSFGIGGEIELRSGLHAQKQVITSPLAHFGLGEATRAEVVRIGWPNGALQSEFDTQANQTVLATQRLKGSCPWLFAWNGREMAFVTDLIWRSPLGLRINAQATADVLMTEDWVKVRGDQLVPRDGAYDLRITAELWETHFFDLVSLMTVDHPAGTEVFVDERFAVPAPPLHVIPTGPVQSFATVHDDQGRDVSELARVRDSRHVDFAGRGPYQGITRPHHIELELPDRAPRQGPLWLIAQGWVHPTDSSINVAVSQGSQTKPEGLSLRIADSSGRFRTVRSGLGFPSGKDKTILIDLTSLFPATGPPRRLQLATNLEIFWDRLGWAVGRPDVTPHPRRLDLLTADLRFRGYSATGQADPSSPERPRYTVEGTVSRWRDLEGYYTRFGDVRPLIADVDDRYVIMNAGDELRLRFKEAPAPAPGWVRDFVVIGDGWVKDGDYNTRFSRTVLPLPTHRRAGYETPPGTLEEDPLYQQHAADFAEYHTRYVTQDATRDALRGPQLR